MSQSNKRPYSDHSSRLVVPFYCPPEARKQHSNEVAWLEESTEGEEEVGSDHLGEFVAQNRDKLSADIVLVSDTAILSNDVPSITTGLRGLSYMEVEVTGPNRDLHSGVYGGAVAISGDKIVAVGTPEEVAKVKRSFTGQFLAKVL